MTGESISVLLISALRGEYELVAKAEIMLTRNEIFDNFSVDLLIIQESLQESTLNT